VQEFIQNIRVQKAKELLTGSELCLKEIAANCGFKTPQYFSTVFRRQEHMTPGQYRKLYDDSPEFPALM
jgi:AraC-like DNA-binding protein